MLHVAGMHGLLAGLGSNRGCLLPRGLRLPGAGSKTRDVRRLRGDSAVRPRGGSLYSGTASTSVRAQSAAIAGVMLLKSGDLGTAGCLAAALLRGSLGCGGP
eukprot:1248893-Rhodomonas_salina.1